MSDATAHMLQRLTAAIMAPLVIIHLGVILYAIESGLTADEILTRTRSNVLWPGFYLIFVSAAALHAPIGLRNIMREWTKLGKKTTDGVMLLLMLLFAATGLRAVWAVM